MGVAYCVLVHPVSRRLRDARERAGLSQAELARAAGVHASYVSHLERGSRAPGRLALSRVAGALGVTVDHLLEGEESASARVVRAALDHARRLHRVGQPAAAAQVLAQVDLAPLDVDAAARVRLAHAEALDLAGELEASCGLLERTAADLVAARRFADAAYAATRLVMALTEAGEPHRAVARGEELLAAVADGADATDALLRLESTLVWAYVTRGDVTYALVRSRSLLERAAAHGSARGLSSVRWNLAFVLEAVGRPQEAVEQIDGALALSGADEVDRDVPRLRLDRAHLLLALEPPRPEAALADLDASRAALELDESRVELARAATVRSRALLALGRVAEAVAAAQDAAELLAGGQRRDAASAHAALGAALAASGDGPGAIKALRVSADLLDTVATGRPAAALWRRLGDTLREAGDDAQEVALAYRRALTAARVGVRPTLLGPTPVSAFHPVR